MRVSTADQKLDSQEKELRRYCLMRGWKNTVIYSEKISGVTTTRPVLDGCSWISISAKSSA